MSDTGTATRRPAAQVPSITGLRLSPVGCTATLVNLSSTGLLASCHTRVPPGTSIRVFFDGQFSPSSVSGQVTRCEVAALDPDRGITYHVGIAFASPIPLDDEPPEPLLQALPPPTPAPLRNRW